MAVQIKPERAYAYAELLEVLSYMDEGYTNKIPKKLMALFKENALSTYEKHIDINKSLEEQNISRKTTALIAVLTVQYWCEDENQKQELLNIFNENERKYQKEIREKYNPDNIFNNSQDTNSTTKEDNEVITNESIEENSSQEKSNENAGLLMDYSNFPWYKKAFTKVKTVIFNFFKNMKKSA